MTHKLMTQAWQQFPNQMNAGWRSARQTLYGAFDQVVVFGMGGSAAAGEIARAAFADALRVPLFVCRDYHVPAWVTAQTLVILVSYSGETEEILAVAAALQARCCTGVVITTGGALATLAQQTAWSLVLIRPKLNSTDQPRTALGYLLGALLRTLRDYGALSMTNSQFEDAIDALRCRKRLIMMRAQTAAYKLSLQPTTLISAEFLTGATTTCANLLLENSKLRTTTAPIPEMNHNVLEAMLANGAAENVMMIDSAEYHPANRYRMRLTKQLLAERGYNVISFEPQGTTHLSMVCELLWWGGFLSLDLAERFEVDAQTIPWITHLRTKLAALDAMSV